SQPPHQGARRRSAVRPRGRALPGSDGRAGDCCPRGTRAHHAGARHLSRLAPARVYSRGHPLCPRLNPAQEVTMLATASKSMSAAEAQEVILTGSAPAGLEVEGTLEFKEIQGLRLPACLKVRRLRLLDCPDLETLPHGLQVRHLEIRGCPGLIALPSGLRCY